MELICGKNESIIKSWDYALEKKGSERKTFNLTATDKRIISSAESKTSFERREIYLADVKSLSFNFERNGMFKAILLLILGIITAVALVGIFLIVAAVNILRAKSFALTIVTYGEESEGISLGASALTKKKSKGKLKVIVHKKDAMEIMNELGAIVLDVKSGAKN